MDLRLGGGNSRDTEGSEKKVIFINWALDLLKERTLGRGFMIGAGSPRGNEGASTPYTQ